MHRLDAVPQSDGRKDDCSAHDHKVRNLHGWPETDLWRLVKDEGIAYYRGEQTKRERRCGHSSG
jgi:hypothetical protein